MQAPRATVPSTRVPRRRPARPWPAPGAARRCRRRSRRRSRQLTAVGWLRAGRRAVRAPLVAREQPRRRRGHAPQRDPVGARQARDRTQCRAQFGIEGLAGRPGQRNREFEEQALERVLRVDALLGALARQRAAEGLGEQAHARHQLVRPGALLAHGAERQDRHQLARDHDRDADIRQQPDPGRRTRRRRRLPVAVAPVASTPPAARRGTAPWPRDSRATTGWRHLQESGPRPRVGRLEPAAGGIDLEQGAAVDAEGGHDAAQGLLEDLVDAAVGQVDQARRDLRQQAFEAQQFAGGCPGRVGGDTDTRFGQGGWLAGRGVARPATARPGSSAF